MDPKSLTKDFKEFLQLLNAHGVDYLLIGGHAVAFYGYPRATSDMDIWVAVNDDNATKISHVLTEFGFDVSTVSKDLFLQPDQIVRMGVAPNRIEIQTGIDGIVFSACYPRRITTQIDGVNVSLISLGDLKKNKHSSGRYKDLADLENLP